MACQEWEVGEVKLRFVCGIHDGAVRIGDGDRTSRGPLVDNSSGHGAEMCGAATISDGYGRVWRKDSRGGPTGLEDNLKPESLKMLVGGRKVRSKVDGVGSLRRQLDASEVALPRSSCRGRPDEIVLLPPRT